MHCASGFGVFTVTKRQAGEFLLEYPGDSISKEEGYRREDSYVESDGSFIFYYEDMWLVFIAILLSVCVLSRISYNGLLVFSYL